MNGYLVTKLNAWLHSWQCCGHEVFTRLSMWTSVFTGRLRGLACCHSLLWWKEQTKKIVVPPRCLVWTRHYWQVETGDAYISSSLWRDDSYTQGCRSAQWLADKGQTGGFPSTCTSTMATISPSTINEHHDALLFQNILVHHILYIHWHTHNITGLAKNTLV
jgi:hypothetical protein